MSKALELLRGLHYQVCNGGWNQACGNGYVDKLDEFGIAEFMDELKAELGNGTPEADEALKAAKMFKEALDKTELVSTCGTCYGVGCDEDDNECDECEGRGNVYVDKYADVCCDEYSNSWAREWDERYYREVNSKIIDSLTGQSGTHSRALDMIKDRKSTGSARCFKYRGRLVHAATKREAIRKVLSYVEVPVTTTMKVYGLLHHNDYYYSQATREKGWEIYKVWEMRLGDNLPIIIDNLVGDNLATCDDAPYQGRRYKEGSQCDGWYIQKEPSPSNTPEVSEAREKFLKYLYRDLSKFNKYMDVKLEEYKVSWSFKDSSCRNVDEAYKFIEDLEKVVVKYCSEPEGSR